jgi:hypothetical protein
MRGASPANRAIESLGITMIGVLNVSPSSVNKTWRIARLTRWLTARAAFVVAIGRD